MIKLDYYRLRAAEMFHVAYGQVTPTMRERAKRILFAHQYFNKVATRYCSDDSIKYAN